MNTYATKPADIERRWYLVDAEGQALGRLASRVAGILRGKTKPIFSPHIDTGDHVIVVNAGKVLVTGRKAEKKLYYHHSGYPGGLKTTSFRKMVQDRPERVIELAVRGMLPRNRLGRAMAKKLKVYAGPVHPHEAQKPVKLEP
ncbi:MAG: 50S ribosomal protein L13 [Bacillota bacterium]|jgi:large subunit ribosomal protein L13|nr:MAG: 50S ribosomal protein L13 [Bacillota bacterium]